MTKRTKTYLLATLVTLLFASMVVGAQAANLSDAFKKGGDIDKVANTAGYEAGASFESMAAKIINALLSLLGVIFLALMIYGGILWMTAKGNDSQVTKAKDLISAAVIGLLIVVSSYAISYFILKYVGDAGLKGGPGTAIE